MKYPTETTIVYDKIKKESKLNDEALALIGINKDKINKAIDQCISRGFSRKKAMQFVYNLWKKSNPDTKPAAPTAKEMTMMGFVMLSDRDRWKHTETGIEIASTTLEYLLFSEVEAMVLNEKNKTK